MRSLNDVKVANDLVLTSVRFSQQPRSRCLKDVKRAKQLTPSSVISVQACSSSFVRAVSDANSFTPASVKYQQNSRRRPLKYCNTPKCLTAASVTMLLPIKLKCVKLGSMAKQRNPSSVTVFVPYKRKLLRLTNRWEIISTSFSNSMCSPRHFSFVVAVVAHWDQWWFTSLRVFIDCIRLSQPSSGPSKKPLTESNRSEDRQSQVPSGSYSWQTKPQQQSTGNEAS